MTAKAFIITLLGTIGLLDIASYLIITSLNFSHIGQACMEHPILSGGILIIIGITGCYLFVKFRR